MYLIIYKSRSLPICLNVTIGDAKAKQKGKTSTTKTDKSTSSKATEPADMPPPLSDVAGTCQ